MNWFNRSHTFGRALVISVLVGMIFALSPIYAARAASWVVNTEDDTNDGACNAAHCSLREAINAANSNRGADTITFSVPNVPTIITVMSALPALTDNSTTIYGAANVILEAGVPGVRYGFHIKGSYCKIQGFRIRDFDKGIVVGSTTYPTVGTIIGVDGNGSQDSSENNYFWWNEDYGIHLTNASVDQTVIAGNLIGIGDTGNQGANGIGIMIEQSTNTRIGTNGDGTSDVLERNVISYNQTTGIMSSGTNTWIAGNYIGLKPDGETAGTSQEAGIYQYGPSSGSVNLIIGSNGDGQYDAVEGNVISGNTNYGITLNHGTGWVIAGNLIGTDAAGVDAVPNGRGIVLTEGVSNLRIGMDLDLPADPTQRNVISGNDDHGIYVASDEFDQFEEIEIVGNYIGVDKNGLSALGNGGHGINIANYARPVIASVTDTWPNRQIIANNGGDGIHNTYAVLSKNSIYANGGAGIWVVYPWFEPAILGASHNGSTVVLNLELDAFEPNQTWVVEFFASPYCDPSTYGEGMVYFHSVTLTTDASGNASAITSTAATFPASWSITATATRQVFFPTSSGFSQCIQAN